MQASSLTDFIKCNVHSITAIIFLSFISFSYKKDMNEEF